MLTLWLATGLLAGQEAPPPVKKDEGGGGRSGRRVSITRRLADDEDRPQSVVELARAAAPAVVEDEVEPEASAPALDALLRDLKIARRSEAMVDAAISDILAARIETLRQQDEEDAAAFLLLAC